MLERAVIGESRPTIGTADEPVLLRDFGDADIEAFDAYHRDPGFQALYGSDEARPAPVQGHISGVVDIPNACATLWLPTDIFNFDVQPNASGPTKAITGTVDVPLAPDLKG